jgi:hypothetical protein
VARSGNRMARHGAEELAHRRADLAQMAVEPAGVRSASDYEARRAGKTRRRGERRRSDDRHSHRECE